jgi:hypothetical protein
MDEEIHIEQWRTVSFYQESIMPIASRESFSLHYDDKSMDVMSDMEILQVQYPIFIKNISIIPW